jgi:hypothetical protein
MQVKKIVCIIMALSFLNIVAAQDVGQANSAVDDYQTGLLEGKISAGENYSGGGWFAAGLGGGFLLGLIGTGIVVGISQSGTVDPPHTVALGISQRSNEYKLGYYDGYSKTAKKKRLGPSIIGGVIGTAVVVAIIVGSEK